MHTRRPGEGSDHGVGRWLDLTTVALGIRYRTLELPQDTPSVHQVQHTFAFRGQFKLDEPGHYTVQAGAATGRGFRGGWNDTGIGTGTPGRDLSLKELFVIARPTSSVQVEVGGLYLVRGENTEATSYDNDGYIVGQRVTLSRPTTPLIDEISLTRAHLGDLDRANVFTRLHRLDRANYYQAFVRKHIAGRASASVDYTWQAGTDVIRGAFALDLNRLAALDRIRFENYVRVDPAPAHGYCVTLQRQLCEGVMAAGGFSDIDSRFGTLSGDLTGIGRRVFGSMSVRIGSGWVGSVQLARAVSDRSTPGPRTRLDIALGYDVLRALSFARARREGLTSQFVPLRSHLPPTTGGNQ